MTKTWILSIILILIGSSLLAQNDTRLKEIEKILTTNKELCSTDNGLLWGKELNVPFLFTDFENRMIFTNNSCEDLPLQKAENGLFYGKLTDNIRHEKGPQKIAGKLWAVIPLPLPRNPMDVQCLLIHEAFHCLQPELELQALPYENSHMEKMDARLWMKLEWKALQLALLTEGDLRKQAITDAICFRKYRRSLYSNCETCENRFEIHEGMAEYTAQKICKTKLEFRNYLLSKLTVLWESKSLTDCFAYFSGPVYAYLLDDSDLEWRNHLGAKDDIADWVHLAYHISLPKDLFLEAEERSVLYDGARIMGEELDRQSL